jgi:hypothetical protein
VLKLKKVIATADQIELLADNRTCVDNCGSFARTKGFDVSVSASDGIYTMTLTKPQPQPQPQP